jgi:hypothetical protein
VEIEAHTPEELRGEFDRLGVGEVQQTAVLRAAFTAEHALGLAVLLVGEWQENHPAAGVNEHLIRQALDLFRAEMDAGVRDLCEAFVADADRWRGAQVYVTSIAATPGQQSSDGVAATYSMQVLPGADQVPEVRATPQAAGDQFSETLGLLALASATIQYLEQLDQECADAATMASSVPADAQTSPLPRVLRSTGGTARVVGDVLRDATGEPDPTQSLLEALGATVPAVRGSADHLLEAAAKTQMSQDVFDHVIRVAATALTVLNPIADEEARHPSLAGATAHRDSLVAQIHQTILLCSDHLSTLPAELLTQILHFLAPADVQRLGLASRLHKSSVQAYQTSAEGKAKHGLAVTRARSSRRQARARYLNWFAKDPQSFSLLDRYASCAIRLRAAIDSLRELVDQAEGINAANEQFKELSDELNALAHMSNRTRANGSRLATGNEPLVDFDSLYDGAANRTFRQVETAAPIMLNRIEAALDRVEIGFEPKLRRSIGAVRQRSEQFVKAFRELTRAFAEYSISAEEEGRG